MVTEFTIKRNKWLRGERSTSMLLNQDGRQCCVGTYLSVCGVDDDNLLHKGTAGWVAMNRRPLGTEWLFDNGVNSDPARVLYDANDIDLGSGHEDIREANVAQLFRNQGITVTFED